MDVNQVAALLGPRYCWAYHTEPVKRMMDYATMLEEKLAEAQAVKSCGCNPK